MLGICRVCVNTKPFKMCYTDIRRLVIMEITWIEQQANGIEVEETEISQEEFDLLFGDEPEAVPVNH